MKTVKDLCECLEEVLKEANEQGLLIKGPKEPANGPLPVTDQTELDEVSPEDCDKIVAYAIRKKWVRDAPTGALAVKVEGFDELIKAITGLKES
jgi:hypothetical protein